MEVSKPACGCSGKHWCAAVAGLAVVAAGIWLAGCGVQPVPHLVGVETSEPKAIERKPVLQFVHAPTVANPIAVIGCYVRSTMQLRRRSKYEMILDDQVVGTSFSPWRYEKDYSFAPTGFEVSRILVGGKKADENCCAAYSDQVVIDVGGMAGALPGSGPAVFRIEYTCPGFDAREAGESGGKGSSREASAKPAARAPRHADFQLDAELVAAIRKVWPHISLLRNKPDKILAHYWSADALLHRGSPGFARVLAERGLGILPGSDKLKPLKGEIMAGLPGRKGATLEEIREEVLSKKPAEGRKASAEFMAGFNRYRELKLAYNRGVGQEREGNYEKAIELYEETAKAFPEAMLPREAVLRARFCYAQALQREGYLHRACDRFIEALDANQYYVKAREGAASCFQQLAAGAATEMRSRLERLYRNRALLFRLDVPMLLREGALDSAAEGRRDAADFYVDRLLKVSQGSAEARAAEIEVFIAFGEHEAAKVRLEEFRRAFPIEARLYNGLHSKLQAAMGTKAAAEVAHAALATGKPETTPAVPAIPPEAVPARPPVIPPTPPAPVVHVVEVGPRTTPPAAPPQPPVTPPTPLAPVVHVVEVGPRTTPPATPVQPAVAPTVVIVREGEGAPAVTPAPPPVAPTVVIIREGEGAPAVTPATPPAAPETARRPRRHAVPEEALMFARLKYKAGRFEEATSAALDALLGFERAAERDPESRKQASEAAELAATVLLTRYYETPEVEVQASRLYQARVLAESATLLDPNNLEAKKTLTGVKRIAGGKPPGEAR